MKLGKKKTPKKKASKKGSKKAPKKAKVTKSPETLEAEKAVKAFYDLRDQLSEEETIWEAEFSDASEALVKLEEIKAQAVSAIAVAKGAIAAAKETIGEFRYVPSFSSSKYEAAAVMEILCSIVDDDGETDFEEVGRTLFALYEKGIVTGVSLDMKAAKIFHDRGGDLRDQFESAWDPGGKELSGRVFTPKI
jgi:hypothetical protein